MRVATYAIIFAFIALFGCATTPDVTVVEDTPKEPVSHNITIPEINETFTIILPGEIAAYVKKVDPIIYQLSPNDYECFHMADYYVRDETTGQVFGMYSFLIHKTTLGYEVGFVEESVAYIPVDGHRFWMWDDNGEPYVITWFDLEPLLDKLVETCRQRESI
jgi:hypothetical protein